ncbi:MAG: CapA family protein [Dehalococcoidia bacterium]|nr:CapA family protein [Dehalococcoidia bacterium]
MESTQPRNSWTVAFVVSLIAFILSCGVLVVVVLDTGSDAPAAVAGSDPPFPIAGGKDTTPKMLQFVGPLPKGLDSALFRGAFDVKDADISFESSADGESVAHRFFVPIVPLHAGLDSVTGAQLEELLGGRLSFADVGGLGGVPTFVIAATATDARTIGSFTAARPETVAGDTYDDLFAAMADPESALIAFVPLDELRPSVSALAVDGADIARGKGDPDAWPFVESVSVLGLTKAGKEAAPGILAALRTELPPITTVVATGDILQSRCSLEQIIATGDWGAALRGPVGEYLAAADLALGSLDGSIQDINPPFLCVPGTNLSSPPEVMEALTLAGIDGVTVATNHIFDCGQEYCGTQAFLRTLELLDEAGIKYVGGGINLEAALAPAIFAVNGVTFGVLGFDDVAAYELEATATEPGTAPLDDSYAEENAAGEPAFFRPAEELSLTRFVDRIQRLKSQVDVVIVQVQTGTEDTHDPSPRSIKALRAAADAGADLVVGNQAHHVQAVETRGDTFIAYALGNFIFDQVHTPEHTQGYLLEASFHGKRLANVRMVPYQIEEKYKPTFVDGALRAKILDDVFSAYLPAQD